MCASVRTMLNRCVVFPLYVCNSLYYCIAFLRKKQVRFDSFRFRTFGNSSVRFGSVQTNVLSRFDTVRPALFGRVVARCASVRLAPRHVPAGSRIKRFGSVRFGRFGFVFLPVTPNPPTNIVPTKIARVKLSGEIPRKSLWAWEFHTLELRLCWSQTLRNPQCE